MTRPTHAEVAIVGGGIAGIAAARELAPDHDVRVLERGGLPGETTPKASGLVSIVHDFDDRPEAARYALEFFESYDGTRDFSYTRRPGLQLVTEDDMAEATADAERVAANGFDVEVLDAAELDERYEGVFSLDRFVAGVEFTRGGWVDPYTLAMAMKDDAAAAGATFETGVTVEDVTVEDGAVTGVDTDAGHVAADHVVVAAGWHTRRLLADHVDLPVRPFRYQAVNLETDRGFEDYYPVAWEDETNLYWRPEHNGDLHVGGGTYFVANPGDRRESVTEEFRTTVARAIPTYLEGLEDARFVGGDTCPTGDSATPDGRPILDSPAAVPDGLVVATGMHGFGIMASPVVGAAVRALVADEEAPFPLAGFALDRFPDRSADFGSDYIVERPADLPAFEP